MSKNCDVKEEMIISGFFCYEPSVWGCVGRWYDGLWQFVVTIAISIGTKLYGTTACQNAPSFYISIMGQNPFKRGKL